MGVLALINRARALGKVAAERKRLRDQQAFVDATPPDEGLYSFIPRVNPRYKAPRHLDPLVVELERAWTTPTRVTACAPPRHAKTETVIADIALTIKKFPEKTCAYVTYEANVALSKSRKARTMALAAGVKLAPDANRLAEWRTTEGGGLLATGMGGPLTSHGVDFLFVDDPYKNRVQAESNAYRRMSADWMDDVAETRIEPGGSVFIFHTRWHPDDLIGHVHGGEAGDTWKHILMPALDREGKALWPERWSADDLLLKKKRVGEFAWASLYQGSPIPRGNVVFGEPYFYEHAPTLSYQDAIGLDLAYTADSRSDYSVAVVMRYCEGKFYVLEVLRVQVEAPDFADKVKALQGKYPKARTRIYAAGTELGAVAFFRKLGVQVQVLAPKGDKFVRAQPVAAAWKNGDVLVPAEAEWVDDYIGEMSVFTGLKDKQDDQVDATAAAFDLLAPGKPMKIERPVAQPRTGLGGF